MTIRTLTEHDAAAWWELRLEALMTDPSAFGKDAEEHRQMPVETIAERFRGASDNYFTLGAFNGDALVGMMTFVRETGIRQRHKGNVYGVYVTPSHRGKGIAKGLMADLLEIARRDSSLEQISLAVSTHQEPAKRLYRSFGFVIFGTERHALKIGSRYVDEDHMALCFSAAKDRSIEGHEAVPGR